MANIRGKTKRSECLMIFCSRDTVHRDTVLYFIIYIVIKTSVLLFITDVVLKFSPFSLTPVGDRAMCLSYSDSAMSKL